MEGVYKAVGSRYSGDTVDSGLTCTCTAGGCSGLRGIETAETAETAGPGHTVIVVRGVAMYSAMVMVILFVI